MPSHAGVPKAAAPMPDPGRPVTDWRSRAACLGADPDLFFPDGEIGHGPKRQAERAKAVCWRCPVQVTCLEWSVVTRQPYGVWGGADESERRAEVRRRSKEAAQKAAAERARALLGLQPSPA